ncbi:hypothetical protein NDU88_001265 [Pleurodeles waltl]|uniref:BTB/POZ domain-containing protein n=1 Tax=Pleurodeles waltl TaxID=8319 RepID=A0AAV7LX65_PLEWA|nr:hypothetical protein NDU88_001265 [Pleurodeles waltl]
MQPIHLGGLMRALQREPEGKRVSRRDATVCRLSRFLCDLVDRKVDGGLKRSFSASNLVLRAASYGILPAQSLVKDFEVLADAMQEDANVSEDLVYLVLHAKFLVDVSADVIKIASVVSSSAIIARCNLRLLD